MLLFLSSSSSSSSLPLLLSLPAPQPRPSTPPPQTFVLFSLETEIRARYTQVSDPLVVGNAEYKLTSAAELKEV
eukprot:2670684-Rhodomonas_salina.1